MPRGSHSLQLSFSGGELSPEMWARFDDARFRAGAARMQNMISRTRGSTARRPGFQHVRKVKEDADSARLLPFRYSNDQTVVIEMGASSTAGYFRFHTDGGTLLHALPSAYRTPHTAISIGSATEEWNLGAHDFESGDPIVFTLDATTTTVAVDTTNDLFTAASHGYFDGDSVLFNTTGTMPDVGAYPSTGAATVESERLYYVVNRTASTFQIAQTRGGPPIDLTSAGSGTITVGCLPSPVDSGGTFFPLDCNKTYYAIKISATNIQIAATRADAVASPPVPLDFTGDGSVSQGDIRVHYDYRNGSVAQDGVNAFYCRKVPWGLPGQKTPDGVSTDQYCHANDHLENGHGFGGAGEYWVQMPGDIKVVTFNATTDRVVWAAHPMVDGDPITFTNVGGALPPQITAGTVYYVRNKTAGDFQLSESLPGPVLDLTGAGSGTHTAFGNPIYEIPHDYTSGALFEVNFVQSNDILTLVHPTRPIAELRRYGATQWVREDAVFDSLAAPPTGLDVVAYGGEGMLVTAVTAPAPPAASVLTFTNNHTFAVGDKVSVEGVGDIPDGHYVVLANTPANQITLQDFESGVNITSTTTTVTSTSRVRPSIYSVDWNEVYVVTALDKDDRESIASIETSVTNNMFAAGAHNTITWIGSVGAERYRIYKQLNGVFGYIGEVAAPTVSFIDDNIASDFSITPPLHDTALRQFAYPTFDTVTDTVSWTAHGLEETAPVVFESDGTLPTGVSRGVTYFVANPGVDTFQLRDAAGALVDMTGSPSGVHQGFAGQWPAAVAYFEQRRVFGGPTLRPQDFWLTASGTENDLSYTLPVKDSNRIHNRIAARERSQIRHAVPVGHLIFLTTSSEYRLTSLNSDALSPESVAARAPTHVGVSGVAPIVVNNTVLFPASRGGHLREMGFAFQGDDYVTGDVSLRAAHFFDNRTLTQLAYQQAPHPIVWAVSSSGSLLGFSYAPEEQAAGWHEHTIDGTFESCAVVAEGVEDRVYVITLREGVRYVERMGSQVFTTLNDSFFVDFGTTYSGAALSSLFLPHLTNKTVSFLADGVVGTGTVDGTGTLTLAVAASTVHVGLAYTSELRSLPLGISVDYALGSGRARNVNNVWLRVQDSGAFFAGESLTSLSKSEDPPSGQLLSQVVQVVILGAWNQDGQVFVQQSDPLPLTVVSMTLEVAVGG